MIVRCLKPFSTGTFAMEQYEIRDVDDTLAAKLISAGLVQEVGGGSGGGGVLAVHDEDGTLDKTWREIIDAVASTGAVIVWENDGTVMSTHIITSCEENLFTQKFIVSVADTDSYYEADTESDNPVLQS